MAVILTNIGFVIESTNYEMREWSDFEGWTEWVELGFSVFYVVEVSLRLLSYRLCFFFGPDMYWNLLDFTLVVSSFFNLLVLSSTHLDISWVRFLRVLRVLKVVRVLRMLRGLGFEDLWLMSRCIIGSVKMFGWCVVMLVFLQFLFAVYFVQALSTHFIGLREKDIDVDPFIAGEANFWFGSVQSAMLSLLMTTTGGADWREVYDIVSVAGWMPTLFYLFYILFFAIAVWNVVTSTFVDKALKLAQSSDEQVMVETRMKDMEDTKELSALFRKMDDDKSNTLTFEEFSEYVRRPEFESFLRARGIDIREAKSFFKMLLGAGDPNNREVEIDALVNGCLRMRGHASSIDLHTLRYEVKTLSRMMYQIAQYINQKPGLAIPGPPSPRGRSPTPPSPVTNLGVAPQTGSRCSITSC
jgi:hypothetical protein